VSSGIIGGVTFAKCQQIIIDNILFMKYVAIPGKAVK
jgi:hypothetical protein